MKDEISGIIPAVDGIRKYREFLVSGYKFGVIMNIHLSLMDSVFEAAKKNGKSLLLHIDRINGLSDDEYGAEYICQKYHPEGAISIKPSVITACKRNSVTAIQRVFLIDSFALEKSIEAVKRIQPDYIEMMPGICADIMPMLKQKLGDNIIAGGLIPSPVYAIKMLEYVKAVTISIDKLNIN